MAHSITSFGWLIGIGSLAVSSLLGCEGDAPEVATKDQSSTPPQSEVGGASTKPKTTPPQSSTGGAPGVKTSPAAGSGATGLQAVPAAGGGPTVVTSSGGPIVTAGAGGVGPVTAGGAGGAVIFDSGLVPKVGDVARSTSPDAPVGVVTAVGSYTPGYSSVTVKYPAEWQCPTDAVAAGTPGTQETLPATTSASAVELAATDCHGLAALRRPALKADSLTQLTMARTSVINTKCRERTETLCVDSVGKSVASYNCRGANYGYGGAASVTYRSAASAVPATNGTAEADGATEYSTTNTQVATVDEADYVKNDGQTIYVLGADGLHVIDAWPAAEAREVTILSVPGEPRRMFLSDNRLVVYSRMQAGASTGVGSSNPSDQGCTYGYDCRFTSEGGHSLAIVYDVSTPAQPRELMRYEMSGGFVAARRVGSFVYTVVHDSGAPQIPGLDYTLSATSYAELEKLFAARVAANNALIDAQNDDYFLPWIQRKTPDGATALQSNCGQALIGAEARGMSFLSLSAFDLTKLEVPTRTVIGSNPGYVYASPEALYLAVDQVPEPASLNGYYYYGRNATNSVVHKFSLKGAETSYRGSVTLPGHILNQFAMDERQGVLRVASTAGWVPDSNVVSYLTTFSEATGTLKQLGQIGGIAPTEDIRSVRFDDDRGFVVTFKKTDPLFVFDLSNPATPRMMGELKIPGFSTYMHRLDQNHLLAVGFEADDQGSFAYFNGIQIQIFDVTDLSKPTLMHKRVIGTRGSGSEALTNHLAFNYFPPKKMLALPITVCEGGGNGSFGNQLTFAGLMAFDISLDAGITEHGRLPFLDPSNVAAGTSCGKWWTDSTTLVKRSIFMDDWIYGLSDAQLRVASLSSMAEPAAVVKLTK
ncbi:MAG TPA: beta-propeller domain-containing protein [Polyangiaceae bacterium]|nr:beta-propeller domain-containing protein [Polyangiaceae bacterium]